MKATTMRTIDDDSIKNNCNALRSHIASMETHKLRCWVRGAPASNAKNVRRHTVGTNEPKKEEESSDAQKPLPLGTIPQSPARFFPFNYLSMTFFLPYPYLIEMDITFFATKQIQSVRMTLRTNYVR